MGLSSLLLASTFISACADRNSDNATEPPPLESMPVKPNIILIMADDLGWSDVGFNGSKTALTPNIDAMASNGLVLDRFYSASPVCSPTRGSVMTGRHPHRFGVTHANVGKLKDEELTLAELLKAEGYTTGFFGKWHLGTLTKDILDANRGGRPEHIDAFSPPSQHGFDISFASESNTPTFDPMLKPTEGEKRTWWNPVNDPSQATEYGTFYWDTNGNRVEDNLGGDDSRVIVDRAVTFIEHATTEEKPFFAVVWLHTPHLPVVASTPDRMPFADLSPYDQHYFGSIMAMDREVGRVREALESLGATENTIVAFTSDNGPEHLYADQAPPGRAEGFRGTKRSLYEGGVRVPSVIEWPAVITAPRRSHSLALTTDYLPTIADILEIDLPDRSYDGRSIRTTIEGGESERDTSVGFVFLDQESWVGERYKLIRNSSLERQPHDNGAAPIAKIELYDLDEDIGETHNIANEHPAIVAEMTAALDAWRSSIDASAEGADYK